MSLKSDLKQLTEAVRVAETELEAATARTALNAAAKKLMRAREALKAAERAPATHAGVLAGAS